MLTHNLLPMSPNICYPCPSPYTPFPKGEPRQTAVPAVLLASPFARGVTGILLDLRSVKVLRFRSQAFVPERASNDFVIS